MHYFQHVVTRLVIWEGSPKPQELPRRRIAAAREHVERVSKSQDARDSFVELNFNVRAALDERDLRPPHFREVGHLRLGQILTKAAFPYVVAEFLRWRERSFALSFRQTAYSQQLSYSPSQ